MRAPRRHRARLLAVGALIAWVAAVAALGADAIRSPDDGRRASAQAGHGRGHSGTGLSPLAVQRSVPASPREQPRIRWRRSEAVGLPSAGRLRHGVQLPHGGAHFFTWDPILKRKPNRSWRRWGTDRLVRTTLRVVRAYAAAHRNAPRVVIGDLGRPHGGDFGPRFGLPGHASHQNGLDVDLYYPRRDRAERPPRTPDQIDLPLAQDLVDRFVRAGAEEVFVGPSTGLRGAPEIVVPLAGHDNHLHVRLPN